MNTIIQQLEYMAWKLTWADSKWKCNTTGNEFKMPSEVRMGDYYEFGQSAVDVGDFWCSRFLGSPVLVEAPHSHLAETIREYVEQLKKEKGNA
jgi:hypothetical protein